MRGIVIPQHDIHALVVQLIRDGLYPRAAHADARTDRVDTLVVGLYGNLGPGAGVARGGADLDDLLGDLRHFYLEQLDQHLRTGAAENQLGPAALLADLLENSAHPVIDPECLAAHQLVARQQPFGIIAQVDDDIITGDLFHSAGYQHAHPALVLLNHLCALGIAYALHNHLLGGLGGNAAEADVLNLLLMDITRLQRRIHLNRFLSGQLGT